MEPTNKAREMEELYKGTFGVDRREAITSDRCVAPPIGCGKKVDGFRDAKSEAEYAISGLCQACQDTIWPPEGGD